MAHYLITGHTGFKGAWMIFLLKAQGHQVSGVALDPVPGSLFEKIALKGDLVHDFRLDIRNREETVDAVRQARPDYVIHMAAQTLVREGYRHPLHTYDTNVLGTLNVLEAAQQADSVQAQLVVTTDKVYRDQGLNRPYVESDPLGGGDPYSASKAMSDILAQEYLSRGSAKPGAVARAGNVVGPGDISKERLIPDISRAIDDEQPLVLRYPDAIRPWQHVLDCLSGYLTLLGGVHESNVRGAWNFGPLNQSFLSVRQVAEIAAEERGVGIDIRDEGGEEFAEASFLLLDSKKAEKELGWGNRYDSIEAIRKSMLPAAAVSRKRIQAEVAEYLIRRLQ